jgi:hypothetical protein
MSATVEQRARDLLQRSGVENSARAGDLVELANLLEGRDALLAALDALVREMRAPHSVRSGTLEGLDSPMIADADRELVAHYWADRLAAALATHRE